MVSLLVPVTVNEPGVTVRASAREGLYGTFRYEGNRRCAGGDTERLSVPVNEIPAWATVGAAEVFMFNNR